MNFSEYIQKLYRIYENHNTLLRLAAGNTEKSLVEAEAKLGFSLDPGLRGAWQVVVPLICLFLPDLA